MKSMFEKYFLQWFWSETPANPLIISTSPEVQGTKCYNSFVGWESHRDGLFENVETSMKQIGDYVVETDGQAVPTWCVRMAGSEDYISNHETEKDAVAAVKRYQAADRRRAA